MIELIILFILVGLVIAGRILYTRFVVVKAKPAADFPPSALGQQAANRPAKSNAAALRQNLRLKCFHDEAMVDRLIEAERQRMPGVSLEALMQAAIERWERDNR